MPSWRTAADHDDVKRRATTFRSATLQKGCRGGRQPNALRQAGTRKGTARGQKLNCGPLNTFPTSEKILALRRLWPLVPTSGGESGRVCVQNCVQLFRLALGGRPMSHLLGGCRPMLRLAWSNRQSLLDQRDLLDLAGYE